MSRSDPGRALYPTEEELDRVKEEKRNILGVLPAATRENLSTISSGLKKELRKIQNKSLCKRDKITELSRKSLSLENLSKFLKKKKGKKKIPLEEQSSDYRHYKEEICDFERDIRNYDEMIDIYESTIKIIDARMRELRDNEVFPTRPVTVNQGPKVGTPRWTPKDAPAGSKQPRVIPKPERPEIGPEIGPEITQVLGSHNSVEPKREEYSKKVITSFTVCNICFGEIADSYIRRLPMGTIPLRSGEAMTFPLPCKNRHDFRICRDCLKELEDRSEGHPSCPVCREPLGPTPQERMF